MDIGTALGYGTTWVSQAIKGMELISKHKAAPEIQKALQHRSKSPAGSGALLDLLQNWDNQHNEGNPA